MSGSSLKNVVVVGGGTAGWLTALYAKMKLPESNVTVVESDSIGILGAGEGATPAFLEFLDVLGIPFSRLVKGASATVKHGIKFTGWTGDSSSYYHGFFSSREVGLDSLDSPVSLHKTNILICYLQKHGISLNNANFFKKISDAGKVGFYVYDDYEGQFVADPIHKYDAKNYFSAHINARKLASLLNSIATEERGVTRIEGTVSAHNQNDSGDIVDIVLESGETIPCDFVFDCTGFFGMFSKKIYESPWVSYKKHLTVNSAQTFFLPPEDNDIPSYTESIALKCGWAWKIPLQNRYGCGYVYDSSHLSEEEAKNEILSVFGPTAEIGQKISFSPGYLEKPWNNNCIAIGLSSGFIEPLEATAIWSSIVSIKEALSDLRALSERSEVDIKRFNSHMKEVNEEILSFVYFHYMGGKDDNEFWRHYTVENAPDSLKKLLETWNKTVLGYPDFKTLFPLESWIYVAEGLGYLNSDLYSKTYDENLGSFDVGSFYQNLLESQETVANKCVSHREFLKDLG